MADETDIKLIPLPVVFVATRGLLPGSAASDTAAFVSAPLFEEGDNKNLHILL